MKLITTDRRNWEDTAKLLLRVALGLLILLHGISKLPTGPTAVMGAVTRFGLPSEFAYLVYVGEVLAPLLLIAGFLTRAAALVVAVNMAFAVALVHLPQFFTLTKMGGWALELQGMYFCTALAVALLGAGRFSVGGASGRWN